MIKLEVEGYCHDCLDFTPCATKPDRISIPGQEDLVMGDTIVRCEYRRRCAGITRYLKHQNEVEASG
jgi:hypothetical protein